MGGPRLRSRKALYITLFTLLGLSVLAVAGAWGALWWAEGRVRDEIVTRAERLGWTVDVDAMTVEIDFGGHVEISGLTAHDDHGGTLSIERVSARLTPGELLDGKRVPDDIEVDGLDVFVHRPGLEAIAERRRAGADGDDEAGTSSATPAVHLHNTRVAVATGTDLGVVRAADLEADLRKESTEGGATWIVDGATEVELDDRHRLTFSVRGRPAQQWAHLKLDFETPVRVHRPGLGAMSVSRVDLAGGPDNLVGNIAGVELVPEGNTGLERIAVEQIDLSLSTRTGRWWPESVRVVSPQATIDVVELLGGPLGRRYPQVVVLVDTAWRHLTGAPLMPPDHGARPGSAVASATATPHTVDTTADTRESDTSLPELRALIDTLPGILVENGGLELVFGGRSVRVQGMGFDTTALRDAASGSRSYAFGMDLRGARADVSVEVPEGAGWPSGSIRLRRLSAADLFAIADVPPPARLAGELDFDLEVARGDAGELIVKGGVAVRDFGFFHRRISTKPLRDVDASLSGTLRYDFDADALRLEEIAATSGPVTVYAEVGIERLRTDPDVRFRTWGQDIDCEVLPDAIPDGMLPTITGLAMAPGRMSPRLEATLRWNDPHTFKMKLEDWPGECRPISVAPHDVVALNSDDYTHTYHGEPMTWLPQGVTVGPGSDSWVPLDALPGYVPASMYLTEDKRFFDHPGLRIGLIERAVRLNLEHRRYVYGGSSISQQLVKNLFLTRTKTLARKLEEVLIVWAMEWEVPKERILELYINCIEFGPDIYGVEQGARFYFDKPAHALTPLEAGYLASLKVAPRRGGKFYKRGFPGWGRWWHKRQRYIQHTLAENGYISPIEAISGYPFMPPFDFPAEGDLRDPRNEWLQRHADRVFDF